MASHNDRGDGLLCPNGDHGKMYVMQPSEKEWCPACQCIFAPSRYDEVAHIYVPGKLLTDNRVAEGGH